jgi:PAS domain S-box-containing protein
LLDDRPTKKHTNSANTGRIRANGFGREWIVIFAVVGSLLSGFSAWTMSNRDKSHILSRFGTIVEARSELLRHGIEMRLHALRPLTGAFAVDASLDRDTFKAFLRKALPRINGLRRVSWLPRIGDAERIRFEQTARMAGQVGFQIMDRDPDGRLIIAPERSEYFPVVFSVTGNGAEDATNAGTIGIDYWSNPRTRVLMSKARDSGQPVVSSVDITGAEKDARPKILVFQPIYRSRITAVSIEDRRSTLTGFAVGQIDVHEMFETAISGNSAPTRLDMYYFKPGAQGSTAPIYIFSSRLRDKPFIPVQTKHLRTGLHWERKLNIGGQSWSVVFRRSENGLPLFETRTAWAVLICGLVMTLLIAAFMSLAQRRNREIEGLIEEISKTNSNMKVEIEERVQTERKFRKLIEAAPDATVVCDRYGGIVHINARAEELFGYSKVELLGQKIEILMPKRFRGGHHLHRTGFYQHSQTRAMGGDLELHAVTKSGREFPAEIGLGPIGNGDDWLVSTSIRDMTQRKMYEAELNTAREQAESQASDLEDLNITLTVARDQAEAAVRTKSEFLTLMSHELRTPLNAVLGFSQILRSESYGPLGDQKYRQYADNIFTSGQNLLELIENILDLTKFDSGRLALEEEVVDINDLIVRTVRKLKERALSDGVALKYDIDDDEIFLRCDERKLNQILFCLISNGIKFTKAGGEVDILAWCDEENGFVIQIADTGIGMKRDDISKALTPFGQVDSALTRQYSGSGLGLNLTSALVDLHGGSLNVQSEPNVGTTVTVRFPADRIVPATPETATFIG